MEPVPGPSWMFGGDRVQVSSQEQTKNSSGSDVRDASSVTGVSSLASSTADGSEKYLSCDLLPEPVNMPTVKKNKRNDPDWDPNCPNVKRKRRNNFRPGKKYFKAQNEAEFSSDDYVKRETTSRSSISTWKPGFFNLITSRESTPFYYHIPSNPAPVNVLPPGTYLVIPQGKTCKSALKFYNHPQVQSRNICPKGNPYGPYGYACVAVEQDLTAEQTNGNSDQPVRQEANAEAAANQEPRNAGENDNPQADSASAQSTWAENNIPPATSELDIACERMRALGVNPVSFLKRRLPYCGVDEIEKEWATKKHKNWKELVVHLRERKVLQIYDQVLPHIPSKNPEYLKREIRGILSNYNCIEDIVAAMKERKKNGLLEENMSMEPDFDIPEANGDSDSDQGDLGKKWTNCTRNPLRKKGTESNAAKLGWSLNTLPVADPNFGAGKNKRFNCKF